MKTFEDRPRKKEPVIKLEEALNLIDGVVDGSFDPPQVFKGIGNPEKASGSDIVFIQQMIHFEKTLKLRPGAVVVEKGKNLLDSQGIPLIRVDDVKHSQIRFLNFFNLRRDRENLGIHPDARISGETSFGNEITVMAGAVIMPGVTIGENVIIYPNVTIEYDAQIGENSIIYPNAIIGERCIIGRNNIIYGGAVIGTDGFGYYDKGSERMKISQIGIVRTEEYVEIGANVCIDRSTVHETVIGAYTKIDNLVQIGHNCKVGEKCYIVSQVGIAGSTNLGKGVTLGGQVAISDHCNIGDGAFVFGQSGVPDDVAPGEKVFGSPARPVKVTHKINGALPYLPELLKRVSHLEKKSEESEKE